MKNEQIIDTKVSPISPTTSIPDNSIVLPAVSADRALEVWQTYQELKKKIIEKEDIQKIGNKEFLKKSFWRKLATFFNLSIDIVEEKKEILGRTLLYNFTVRATAPNGRSTTAVGSCDCYEKATRQGEIYVDARGQKAKPNSIHNTRSTAETRAINRAISNLVGGGEVSAEEVEREYTTPAPAVKSQKEYVDPDEIPFN